MKTVFHTPVQILSATPGLPCRLKQRAAILLFSRRRTPVWMVAMVRDGRRLERGAEDGGDTEVTGVMASHQSVAGPSMQRVGGGVGGDNNTLCTL